MEVGEPEKKKKNDKTAKMKGWLGWIRGLIGQEQDISSLSFSNRAHRILTTMLLSNSHERCP